MLAVAGGKGGVGTTTTTLGVALALGRAGRAVVAVDADRDAPDLARVAGVGRDLDRNRNREARGASGAEACSDPAPIEALARGAASLDEVGSPHPDCPRVTVIPAGHATPSTYREALVRLAADDRQVLVDCPAGAGRDVALPLRLAERALIVSTPRPAALRDALKTAAMADALGTTLAGVVLTRCRTVPRGTEDLFDGTPATRIPAVAGGRPTALPDEYARVIHRFIGHNG